jgi:hypothetical protein
MLDTDFSLLVFVKVISIFVSVTGLCCVLSWYSHPRGTLASRSWAAQTANSYTSVRAHGMHLARPLFEFGCDCMG